MEAAPRHFPARPSTFPDPQAPVDSRGLRSEPVVNGIFRGADVRLPVEDIVDRPFMCSRVVDLPEKGGGVADPGFLQEDQWEKIPGSRCPRHQGETLSLHLPDRTDSTVLPDEDDPMVRGTPVAILRPGEHHDTQFRVRQQIAETP